MKSTIRLFNALPIKTRPLEKVEQSDELLEKTIRRGFIFSPEVICNYNDYDMLIDMVEKEIGLTPEKLNNSFHKSWDKVRNADMIQLVTEQLVHYITTYGFEELGIFNSDSVYIPNEKLEIPELESGITLTIIKGYTKEELKEKLMKLITSGIALNEDTMEDIMNLALFLGLSEDDIKQTKNKEVKIMMYDYLNVTPENPTEFLRLIIYKTTKKTLIIKNYKTIESIKTDVVNDLFVIGAFHRYNNRYGYERLAEVFNRYKPLFLALKQNEPMKSIINKISKLSKEHHKPMKEDYLNEVTSKIKNGVILVKSKLNEELNKVNTFRKIRLAYALNYRTNNTESIIYKIRNGKGYATEFNSISRNESILSDEEYKKVFNIVLESIIKDISKNVKDKKIYIPNYITYALPTTEKQFTGNFPSGTYISTPRDMIVGIHWENTNEYRIDLDLSMINSEKGKIGWNAAYRTEDRSILFSGDITDAPKPKGATELFYVEKQREGSYILINNYYNYDKDVEVPFKIIVAGEPVKRLTANYTVNPNNVLSVVKTKINQKQQILGLLTITPDECRFYFTETYIGNDITSSENEFVNHSRRYLSDYYKNTISFNEVLEKAGAIIVNNKDNCDIDLSPENIEKDTIIKLII